MIPNDLVIHNKIWIPKSEMPTVPPGFEETWLGELKGARKQYRGPDNLHLLQYEDGWELHQDQGDPRTLGGFIIHIFLDAPEVGVALLVAAGKFTEKYDESGSILEAIAAALGTGVVTYAGLRIARELLEFVVQWIAANPF
jgi:hypothetical protein